MDDVKTRKLHNKSDKPDNIVEKENKIYSSCEAIEKELPGWMRGYFIYLKSNLLPMSRLSYLRELKFFCNYLISETELKDTCGKVKELKEEDFNQLKGVDINIYIDYCRRYTVHTDNVDYIYENKNAALAHKKSTVSVLFKYLYREGTIDDNITASFDPIRLPKAGEREIKTLEEDEVMRMLDSVSKGDGLTEHEKKYWEKTRYRDKLILLLLVTYGLRLSELQQLNLSSFNFERGEFKIYRKRAKESLMPINNTITSAYDDYVKMERPEEDRIFEGDRDALLLSLQGRRLTDRQIRQIVKKYSSVGMGTTREQGYSPHKLRATAATSLITRGNSIYDVQELLDHENVSTTQLYARHKLNTKRELIRDFEWGEDMGDK